MAFIYTYYNMKTFSLEQHLKAVYGQAPKESKRPVIGITTNHSGIDVTVRELYHNQIVKAGGTPLLIPPIDDADVIQSTLERVDAIILTGGADVNPLWAGEQPSTKLHHINAVRDLPELMITRLAFNRQIPILGICRGVQVLAMALEGRIHQDISHIATNFQRGYREGFCAARHLRDGEPLRQLVPSSGGGCGRASFARGGNVA